MTTHARNATLALLLLSSVHAADWPQFMGPNQNNSVLDETIAAALPAGGPPLVWEVDVSVGFGGAAIVGDE